MMNLAEKVPDFVQDIAEIMDWWKLFEWNKDSTVLLEVAKSPSKGRRTGEMTSSTLPLKEEGDRT